ncbi:MAG: transketolase C-terminal domain-containing protein [Gemmatimonadaceae bacterium]
MTALTEAARRDSRIVLVTGDLGFGVVVDFARERPQQFVNAGVAEQHMTGLAAGLAMSGKIVVTYSIANFPTLRCFEQIRNDVCGHRANVKVVSVGGGYAYGALGASHHATEDLAVMRALPGLLVVAPNDPIETRLATTAVLAHDGPCYLRLGRAGEPVVHSPDIEFTLGRAIVAKSGSDVTLVATGGMLSVALAAAEQLAAANLDARVLSMHTVKPIDRAALSAAARETSALFTLEEHSIVGGLGSACAEVLLEEDVRPVIFRRLGVADTVQRRIGDQAYLRHQAGLEAGLVARRILEALDERPASLRTPARSPARTWMRTNGVAAER